MEYIKQNKADCYKIIYRLIKYHLCSIKLNQVPQILDKCQQENDKNTIVMLLEDKKLEQ